MGKDDTNAGPPVASDAAVPEAGQPQQEGVDPAQGPTEPIAKGCIPGGANGEKGVSHATGEGREAMEGSEQVTQQGGLRGDEGHGETPGGDSPEECIPGRPDQESLVVVDGVQERDKSATPEQAPQAGDAEGKDDRVADGGVRADNSADALRDSQDEVDEGRGGDGGASGLLESDDVARSDAVDGVLREAVLDGSVARLEPGTGGGDEGWPGGDEASAVGGPHPSHEPPHEPPDSHDEPDPSRPRLDQSAAGEATGEPRASHGHGVPGGDEQVEASVGGDDGGAACAGTRLVLGGHAGGAKERNSEGKGGNTSARGNTLGAGAWHRQGGNGPGARSPRRGPHNELQAEAGGAAVEQGLGGHMAVARDPPHSAGSQDGLISHGPDARAAAKVQAPLASATLADTRQRGSFGAVRPPRESAAMAPSPIWATLAPAPVGQPIPRHLLAVLEKKQLQQQPLPGGEGGGGEEAVAVGGSRDGRSAVGVTSGSMFGVWKPDPVHVLGVAHLDEHVRHRNVNINLAVSEGHPGDPLALDPARAQPRYRDAFPGIVLGDCKNKDRDGARSPMWAGCSGPSLEESGAIHLAPISPERHPLPLRQQGSRAAGAEARRKSLGALPGSPAAHQEVLRRASLSPPPGLAGTASGGDGSAPRDASLSPQQRESAHRLGSVKLAAVSLDLDPALPKSRTRDGLTSPGRKHAAPRSLAPLHDTLPGIKLGEGDHGGAVSPLGLTFPGSGQQAGGGHELQGHVPGFQHPSFTGKVKSPTGSGGSFWSQKGKLGKVAVGQGSPPPLGSLSAKPVPIGGLVLEASRKSTSHPGRDGHSPYSINTQVVEGPLERAAESA